MKKAISVVLCVLMLMSVTVIGSFAAIQPPETPDAVSFTDDGIATWVAVDGADRYKVQLYIWTYDSGKAETWVWKEVGAPIIVKGATQCDLSELIGVGYFTFAVAAGNTRLLGDTEKEYTLYGEFSAKPLTASADNVLVIKTEAEYPWNEPNTEEDALDSIIPDGEIKDLWSLVKRLFEIIKGLFDYLLNFDGVKDLVK